MTVIYETKSSALRDSTGVQITVVHSPGHARRECHDAARALAEECFETNDIREMGAPDMGTNEEGEMVCFYTFHKMALYHVHAKRYDFEMTTSTIVAYGWEDAAQVAMSLDKMGLLSVTIERIN